MSANIGIVSSTLMYILLAVVMYMLYKKKKFNGNEIAGNAMAKGLTFIYGLGILLLIAIVLTIIYAFFLSNVTLLWIKFLSFVPISIPLIAVLVLKLEDRKKGKSKN